MLFEIIAIITSTEPYYLIVEQLDAGHFELGQNPTLNNIPINRSIIMPRKLNADGTPSFIHFVFTLKIKEDIKNFKVGQIVELGDE